MAKIELGARGDPSIISARLPQHRCSHGAWIPAEHRAWLVKAAVNEITSTSPAKAIIYFREAI